MFFAVPALACLWDYDTIRDEKRGMPGMAEVLAGQWEKHSAFFYRHRVDAMKAKLAATPDAWDAMGNLAVAHAKLGELDAAIAVMLDKEKRHPDQYTTSSNLGTFYMFKGDMPAAIVCLKKALKINPNAHFGREEYQLKLAEFLVKAKADPAVYDDDFLELRSAQFRDNGGKPLLNDATSRPYQDEFFLESLGPRRLENLGVKPNAIEAVVGMIRFGTDQSPELYFALGDLLAARGDKNLAYRAYQRALDANYPRPEVVRRAMAKVKEMSKPQAGFDPAVIAAERADAAKWVADYQAFEDGLIRDGKNVDDDDAAYAPFYASHGRVLKTNDFFIGDELSIEGHHPGPVLALSGCGIAGGVTSMWILIKRFYRFPKRPKLTSLPNDSDWKNVR
jgi:tetratricopeptide (TPR) repeat protein